MKINDFKDPAYVLFLASSSHIAVFESNFNESTWNASFIDIKIFVYRPPDCTNSPLLFFMALIAKLKLCEKDRKFNDTSDQKHLGCLCNAAGSLDSALGGIVWTKFAYPTAGLAEFEPDEWTNRRREWKNKKTDLSRSPNETNLSSFINLPIWQSQRDSGNARKGKTTVATSAE